MLVVVDAPEKTWSHRLSPKAHREEMVHVADHVQAVVVYVRPQKHHHPVQPQGVGLVEQAANL
jgi:hypothetical protein